MSKIDQLRQLLDQIERWELHIREALASGGDAHTYDDVVSFILNNRVFFYSYSDCFIIMERIQYPQFNVFHCWLAGGNKEALFPKAEDMRAVAIELDCKYLSIAGRKGWERPLSKRGWRHIATTMYLPTEDTLDEWWRKGRAANINGGTAARN